MKDDRLYLIHMRECIARITEYVKGGQKEFMDSGLIQDAVLRNLQTFSESTQRLSQDFKSKHSSIDWRGIAAFRNILVHNYLGINIERVWGIIETDFTVFKKEFKKILKDLDLPKNPRSPRKTRKKDRKK
jgi:uncharacterized protein with HEPN domain